MRKTITTNAEIRKVDLSLDGSKLLVLARLNHQPIIEVVNTDTFYQILRWNASDGAISPNGKSVLVVKTEIALPTKAGSARRLDNAANGDMFTTVAACEVTWAGYKKPMFEPAGARKGPLAFSRDGTLFAAGMEEDRVAVFCLSPVKGRRCTILNHMDDVLLAAFTPDNGSLVTASRDSTLRVSCAATGMPISKLEVQTHHRPTLLRVSSDGNLIVSVWGPHVHLWLQDSGDLTWYNLNITRRTMEGWPLAISPDCRYLACRIEDGLDITDVQTGTVVGLMSHMGSPVTSACFSLGGEVLIVGKLNGMVEQWQLSCPSD
jgi:WD40 repeat protein